MGRADQAGARVRVLVTGAGGFVGGRLVRRLAERGDVEVHGLVRREPPEPLRTLDVRWHAADLAEAPRARQVVRAIGATRLFHLGALANPRACAAEPCRAWCTNARGTVAVLCGFFEAAPEGRGLVASTAQVYGRRAGRLSEDLRPEPVTVYGRTKLAAERVARGLARRGRAVVIARAFNHTGRGQAADYVVPALAASLRRALETGAPLRHGNLFPRRDFLHVEDVLDAYEVLLERGAPGAAYNVCRGEAVSIGAVLDGLVERLGAPSSAVLDPALARGDDPEEIVGDAHRLHALGWSPAWSLDAMLDDVARPPL